MATLKIINSITGTDFNGSPPSAHQGLSGSAFSTPHEQSVSGYKQALANTLADSAAATLWASTQNLSSFEYFFFVPYSNCQLQIKSANAAIVVPLKAGVPFVLHSNLIGNSSSTTTIAATATTETITLITVWNNSGQAMTYDGWVVK